MAKHFRPIFEALQRHAVTGLVGSIADQGLAYDGATRSVRVTMRQTPDRWGAEAVYHHLLF